MNQTSKIKQIEIALWRNDQEQASDVPRERFCVMQDTLEATIAFATEAIRAHWNGECECQKRP